MKDAQFVVEVRRVRGLFVAKASGAAGQITTAVRRRGQLKHAIGDLLDSLYMANLEGPRFSEEQDEFIRTNWLTMPTEAIAQAIDERVGRTEYHARTHLKLPHKGHRKYPQDAES